MRYFLKMAQSDCFEEVDKYTFDNYKSALADDGESPRYVQNSWLTLNEDGTFTVQLTAAPLRDLPILGRSLNAAMPDKDISGKGFVREPETVKFRKGNIMVMRELKTGEEWRKKIV